MNMHTVLPGVRPDANISLDFIEAITGSRDPTRFRLRIVTDDPDLRGQPDTSAEQALGPGTAPLQDILERAANRRFGVFYFPSEIDNEGIEREASAKEAGLRARKAELIEQNWIEEAGKINIWASRFACDRHVLRFRFLFIDCDNGRRRAKIASMSKISALASLAVFSPGTLSALKLTHDGDGLFERFVPFNVATSGMGQDRKPDQAASTAYEGLVRKFLDLPVPNPDHVLRMTPEARAIFIKCEKMIVATTRDSARLDQAIREQMRYDAREPDADLPSRRRYRTRRSRGAWMANYRTKCKKGVHHTDGIYSPPSPENPFDACQERR